MVVKPKIAIIGCGASGLAAATRLLENGYDDIVILEAEGRIGGRIHSVEFGGSVVDLGAQWCHGEKGNIIYDMVKDMNLLNTSYNNYRDNTYYTSSGEIIDKRLGDNIYKIASEIYEDEESAEAHTGSFGDYFIERYNEQVHKELGNSKEVQQTVQCMLDWFHKFFLCLDSSKSWHEVSTRGHYKDCDGDLQLQWRDKGFKTILYILMNKYPDITKRLVIDEKIFLNKEVNKIIWNDKNSDSKVVVRCQDGTSYDLDHVIVTMPLGALKDNYEDMFDPALPPFKVNAIEGLSFGTVNKILLKFPKKWWPNDVKGFSLVWNENDRRNICNEFPVGPSIGGKSWLEYIFGFYVIDSHPNILLGWLVGELASEVELLSDEVVTEGCMYLLRKFVGSTYDVERPDEILRSKWNSNPHFSGSYSYISFETERRKASADDLAAPLASRQNKHVLLFAGEATHPCYYSTVHGAIESGYREADRIINIYKGQQTLVKKVAVIGAGAAGLGAATTLVEYGCDDIIILEAQEKPGGRIQTVEYEYGIIDFGAQWIHGKSNPLYEMAKEHDLLADELSEEGLGKYVRDDGYVFDDMFIEKVNFEVGKILFECEKYAEEEIYPQSVGKYLEQEFEKYLASCDDTDETREMKLQLLDWNTRFQVIDNSCLNLEELSARGWGKYICLDDEAHINLKSGYGSLVDILVSKLPNDVLHTSTSVLRIDYGNKYDKYVKLTCQNDLTVLAEHVILTPSLGVLKKFNNIIHPPLPESHLNAIQHLGFHAIGKIFLVFDKVWWDCEGFQLLWRKNADVGKGEEWTKGITGFDTLYNHPNVLIGWVGGEQVAVMESLSEEQIEVHCMNVLRRFLPTYDIPNPTKVMRTKWLSNPWIRGGYSHITAICDRVGSEINKLAEPVLVDGVPRILLAGEAVHSSHFSTAHGAYESGQDQAKALCQYINRNT